MWEEGPEIEYDRVKAGLTTLLTKEVARREAAAKAAAKKAKADKEGALSASKLPQRPATVGVHGVRGLSSLSCGERACRLETLVARVSLRDMRAVTRLYVCEPLGAALRGETVVQL